MKKHVFLTLVLGLVSGISGQIYRLTRGLMNLSENACQSIARQPYFIPQAVIGKPWRVYYTWNMKLPENACVDVHFQYASREIINRFQHDMSPHLITQPKWEAAQMLATIGKARQEMLFIPDENKALGRFFVVLNNLQDTMIGGMVPLLQYQMKLTRNGKYLFFMDCEVGIASFAMRFDEPVYRGDVVSAAQEFFPVMKEGADSCLNAQPPDEQLVQPEKKQSRNDPFNRNDGNTQNKLYLK